GVRRHRDEGQEDLGELASAAMTTDVEIDIEHDETETTHGSESAAPVGVAEGGEAEAGETQGGVVVGVLLGLAGGVPVVAFPGCAEPSTKARSTVTLRSSDIGSQVALLFENGKLEKPLVIGKILVPGAAPSRRRPSPRRSTTTCSPCAPT